VFHTYGAERISEAQIRDCIRVLNEDYQNKNADSAQVSTLFQPIIGRPQMRFRLATKDPNGRCTEGINYIESSLHTAGGENLKSVISWDTKKYLNIWVCSVVASGAAAYSYYPGSAPGQNNEGVVTRSDYVGSIGTSSPGYRARTLTHEIGHYMNLPHTWGSSNTPGDANNCNIDDGVQDTPNCVGVSNSSCPLSQNDCGPIANVENHMDYSNCRRMFTKGQVLRMHAAMNSTTAFRSSLWKTSNLIATGATTDAAPMMDCAPKADFKVNYTYIITYPFIYEDNLELVNMDFLEKNEWFGDNTILKLIYMIEFSKLLIENELDEVLTSSKNIWELKDKIGNLLKRYIDFKVPGLTVIIDNISKNLYSTNEQTLKDLKYRPFTPVGLFFSIEL
jgi:hypothetical protein